MALPSTPKTDWAVTYDENGKYAGDFFSYVDFNRIRNNLDALTTLGEDLYVFSFSTELPSTKDVTGYPYASDINAFETRLHEINQQSLRLSIGSKKTFTDNGAFIDWKELNRIESATLKLYEAFSEIYGGRRMLKFRLGFTASSIKE